MSQSPSRVRSGIFWKVLCISFKTFTSACLMYMQLKEMCRRELDKAESEIKKNSSIIGDYKQVGPCTWNWAMFPAALLVGMKCIPPRPRASGSAAALPGQLPRGSPLQDKGSRSRLVVRAPGKVSAQRTRRHLISEATLCSREHFRFELRPYAHVWSHSAEPALSLAVSILRT